MGRTEGVGEGEGEKKKEQRPFSQNLDKPTGLSKRTKERNKENNYLVQKPVGKRRTV
jgi:hypothetical protein